MKSILYVVLLVAFSFGLTACNEEEKAPQVTQPEPQKPAVIQKAEQVEAIVNKKAEADKQAIDEATQ
ncbi:MAG: hypothetical protein VSS52_002760 [Thiotrichaceae bacterium]|nr:hypothetical protein [Thiotrichaceae bacterium]